MRGSDHPQMSERETPRTRAAIAAVIMAAPRRSLRPTLGERVDSGSFAWPTKRTPNTTGMLIRNARRHPPMEISQAPRVGPDATPSAPTAAQRDTIWVRRSIGNAASSSPRVAGVKNAAPRPCTARPPMRMGRFGETALINDPNPNTRAPARKTRLRPEASATRPPTTSSDPKRML